MIKNLNLFNVKKILITGGDGYVARSIFENIKDRYEVVLTNKKSLNLLNKNQVDEFFNKGTYDVVVHCAIQGGEAGVVDDDIIAYNNIVMFNNLLEKKSCYKKLINIGSGAEIHFSNKPYGFSKKIINRVVETTDNLYTLRIFNVFDENEVETRFIKTCIKKALTDDFLIINQNKYMDFFYMKDFISVIEFYIQNEKAVKCFDCVYKDKKTLLEIAQYVQKISDWKREITFKKQGFDTSYIGKHDPLNINYIGLENGIDCVFKALTIVHK